MKYTYFTPGPSQLYPTVPYHLKRALEENIASISHRSEEFKEIFKKAVEGIKKLLDIPEEYHVVFVASGTEAMERIIENTVEKKSFHFFNGSFGKRWYETALELKKKAEKFEVAFHEGIRTIPKIPATELICFTHNETSNGTVVDPKLIYTVARQNPHALIAVDIVSSAPYVDLDYAKLDCVFFSVQKLFGLPAGLGVIILSPRAVRKAQFMQEKGLNIGTYHNFPTMVTWAKKYQTLETPNVLGMYLLAQVTEDFLTRGIENIRIETDKKAQLTGDFFNQHPAGKPFINKNDRSKTVIVIDVDEKKKILEKIKAKRFIVGDGYGPLKENQIRIANFPAVSTEDIIKLLTYFI